MSGAFIFKIPLLAVAAACLLVAQQTRREVSNPSASPADDAKPNSDAVPDVWAVKSSFDRVIVLRFKYDTDLLAGITKIVKQEKIKNAVILSAAGSVRNYQIHQVSNRTLPSKNTYEKDPTAPADMIGMNGYVIEGKVHAHVILANPEKAFGGHLEPGTNVFTFAIVTLGVMSDDADFSHLDDKTYR